VGRTATTSLRAWAIISLSDPGQREALAANLDRVVQVPAPVLVDEWQLEPLLWERVHRAVDDDPTGVPIHSGAGRIGSLHMRPLPVSERGLIEPNCRWLSGGTIGSARASTRNEIDLAPVPVPNSSGTSMCSPRSETPDM
jgi:hypothetical protein